MFRIGFFLLLIFLLIYIFAEQKNVYCGGDDSDKIKAILVPHAGYKYIEKVASWAYNQIKWENYKHVIILSTNHYNAEIVIPDNHQRFKYPNNLGDLVTKNDELFMKEHSWQNQLPFLEKAADKQISVYNVGIFKEDFTNFIYNQIDDTTLLIANTDLSHCGYAYGNICENPEKIDDNTIIKIRGNQFNFLKNAMCGKAAVETFMAILKKKKWPITEYQYDNANENGNRVGYLSMVSKISYEPLLSIPHKVINKFEVNNVDPVYDENIHSVFVTIMKNNELRGCIGVYRKKNESLNDMIIESTNLSAKNDPRFTEIKPQEKQHLTYKISFNHKPELIYSDNKQNLIDTLRNNIIINVHGITIEFDDSKSTYLSSVLPEHFDMNGNDTDEKWNKVIDSLTKKNGNQNKKIKKIYRYISVEY